MIVQLPPQSSSMVFYSVSVSNLSQPINNQYWGWTSPCGSAITTRKLWERVYYLQVLEIKWHTWLWPQVERKRVQVWGCALIRVKGRGLWFPGLTPHEFKTKEWELLCITMWSQVNYIGNLNPILFINWG